MVITRSATAPPAPSAPSAPSTPLEGQQTAQPPTKTTQPTNGELPNGSHDEELINEQPNNGQPSMVSMFRLLQIMERRLSGMEAKVAMKIHTPSGQPGSSRPSPITAPLAPQVPAPPAPPILASPEHPYLASPSLKRPKGSY